MRSAIPVLVAVMAANLAVVSCSGKGPAAAPAAQDALATTASAEPAPPPPVNGSAGGAEHRVKLTPGQGGEVGGALDLVASDGAVVVTGLVTGIAPESEHGFHIHAKGDCGSPDFKSAGDHFNPTSQEHGNPASPPHHLGDIPNLKANSEGKANVNARIEGATLGDGGPNDLVGKAFVVHEKMDDYKTQPSGNSGDRIACGVISK